MPTIGERVKYAIDHMERGETYAALEHACNALDVTSQRYYDKKTSSRKHFKNILKEYSWLIEFMSLGGVNLDETTFDNFPIFEGVREPILNPYFSDLMYHVVRCGLVHSDALSEGFLFHEEGSLILAEKTIIFPKNVVWGILSISIFCPINKNQVTAPNYWIGAYENRLVINDFWGNESIARHLASRYPRPRVTLTNLSNLKKEQ
ncbi:TPA: hypothetical protein ACXRW3_003236 [Klebsiella quasipneumoniae subsp. quasipneumoniae]|uniref:hypothetical protein n=1 Tax=Klebsiella TaxID=570 RepID=UPI0005EE9C16|nr:MULTISPECIES: hypothetical protein [Klebsiella]HBW8921032.1 hypothetical protein [Klebsiella pneumoniae subsp. pneumoniae 1158]HCA9924230.1 hypothetical protein [Klebsiella variicola subsp. variicola]HCI6971036.1 hypothetical protein [Klebsiella quasipneumoniae subsp. similipneumoniae]KJP13304.1 hypothetical protein SR67_09480 [Klebsiella aerogenes]MCD9652741.1 hypothetical protein [Klebsiella pneumoniae]